MALVNFVMFVVLKILNNLFFNLKFFKCKKTADVNKIPKTVQADLTFILNVLSESSIDFAQFSTVLPKKNVVSFI